ncbi:MAG: lamin tail domain-containing protein [Deltaproteobacteria bacterium]|nr:lamin tail domain-containing protein [Deltaproteobacteria bacterium]
MSMIALLMGLLGCNPAPTQEQLDLTRGGRIDVYFNEPGTRHDNMWEPDAVDVLIDLIDQSNATLDMAVMGFNRQEVIDAVIEAWDRGVKVRMVGDAGHLYNSGYHQLDARQIPMVTGNRPHIMHDKFFLIDGRFLYCGTANITDTDLRHNSNNFVVIDSPAVVADFGAEFEQMWNGRYGHTKEEIDNGRVYRVGDTIVEVWFSPNEDAMGRIQEYVYGAQESLRFTIFAFTKDQVGSAFILKQAQFEAWNEANGIDPDAPIDERHTVAGVVDQSQLHSNAQYHESYRLLAAGIPMRLDGDDNSLQPGDYQAGGGRLHSKTMVIDAEGENPVVITGSFNWSSSATVSNDEFLLVLRGDPDAGPDGPSGKRIAAEYQAYFERLWDTGRHIGNSFVGEDLEPGELIINEVMWYGVNDADPDGVDEFIELRNLTDNELDLSMWQVVSERDFVVGLPPGSVVAPNDTFLILDHTMEVYQDGVPQDELSAYTGGDLVTNPFNDNRQSRLYLKDGSLGLALQDPRANVADRAGDGGPAFYGGPSGSLVRSMERNPTPRDGTDPANWHACTYGQGGINVNPEFRSEIIATPGEENSPPP